MTTRIFGASALILTAAIALVAGSLVLDALDLLPTGADQQDLPKSPPPRAAISPMIITAASIEVQPASRTPLLIEIGPPEWVPRDSILYLEGLPDRVSLSRGHRASANLWAVSVADLPNLHMVVAPDTSGRSDLTISLEAADGVLLAKSRTAISINAPTATAVDQANRVSSVTGSEPRKRLPSHSAASEILPAAGRAAAAAPVIDEDPGGPTAVLVALRETAVRSRDLAQPPIAPPPADPMAERGTSRGGMPQTSSLVEHSVTDDPESAKLAQPDAPIALGDIEAPSAPRLNAKQTSREPPAKVWFPAAKRSEAPKPNARETQEGEQRLALGEGCPEDAAHSACARGHGLAGHRQPTVPRTHGGYRAQRQTKDQSWPFAWQFGWVRKIFAGAYLPGKQTTSAARSFAP